MRQASRYSMEIHLTVLGIFVTVISTCFFFYDLGSVAAGQYGAGHYWRILSPAVFAVVTLALIYGNLVYLLTRIGSLKRHRQHLSATMDQLCSLYDRDTPSLTVLVPSYKEDEQVVRQTLLSAALMEYPNKRIVLLIDDPPNARTDADARALQHMRQLPR